MFSVSRDSAWLIGLAVMSVLVQLPTFGLTLVSLDEGQLAAIGNRLVEGQLLYRDVYTGIFPGIYWLTAALFDTFGIDVIVTRWAQVAINTGTMLCLWVLARRLAGVAWAWMAPFGYIVIAVVSFPAMTMLAYSSASLLFALVALVFLDRYLDRGRLIDGAAVGAAVVLCGIFKQNYGAFILVTGLISLLWSKRESALADKSVTAGIAVPAAAGFLVGLPVIGYLAATGSLLHAIDSTLVVISTSQLSAYDQPIPPIFGPHPEGDGRFTFLYSPPLLFNYLMRNASPIGNEALMRLIGWSIRAGYGIALLALVVAPFLCAERILRGTPDERRAVRVVIPFACLFFVGIFPSAIWSHLAVVLIPLLLVLVLLLSRISTATGRFRSVFNATVMGITAIVLTAATAYGMRDMRRWHSEPLDIPTVSVRVANWQHELMTGAFEFLSECAADDETIFVLPDMPILYVATGKTNPTPYDLIIPGNVIDEKIVEALRAAGTRCIVRNPHMYVQFESFETLFPLVSAYLESEFDVVRTLEADANRWLCLQRRAPVNEQ